MLWNLGICKQGRGLGREWGWAGRGASQVVLVVKNPPASAGDVSEVGSISGSGRPLGGGHGNLSSILAWRIPWTEESGGLQSIGLQRVRHDWSDLACTHTAGWGIRQLLKRPWKPFGYRRIHMARHPKVGGSLEECEETKTNTRGAAEKVDLVQGLSSVGSHWGVVSREGHNQNCGF